MSAAQTTTDHATIRRWIEERGGRPARVADVDDGTGILRIDFGEPEDSLEEISWDKFFEAFEDNELAFLYQEETDDGRDSRFSKFISRSGH